MHILRPALFVFSGLVTYGAALEKYETYASKSSAEDVLINERADTENDSEREESDESSDRPSLIQKSKKSKGARRGHESGEDFSPVKKQKKSKSQSGKVNPIKRNTKKNAQINEFDANISFNFDDSNDAPDTGLNQLLLTPVNK